MSIPALAAWDSMALREVTSLCCLDASFDSQQRSALSQARAGWPDNLPV
jgi:hypothetical protein